MSPSVPPIAVVGGDERESRLVSRLVAADVPVRTFGVPAEDVGCSSSAEAVADAHWLVCPTPGLHPDGSLYAPSHDGPIFLHELVGFGRRLGQGGIVLGRAPRGIQALAAARRVPLHEIADDEDMRRRFAVAAAEGVLGIVIAETKQVFGDLRITVLGTGRTASAIVELLHACGALVRVAGRRESGLADVLARGAMPVSYARRHEAIVGSDVVINTVPSPDAVPDELLPRCAGKLIIDIASPPGGLQHEYATWRGAEVRWARGLVGRRAPITAGDALFDKLLGLVDAAREPTR
ncbi:dipicolinate synthase subunit DpsA [Pseudonocardia spinosispora]|uniref:dipicolinate synthase subunit DpsA n=1 Tax=Pseudonocardia spinosispora TaxID=103441 RepID=UPI0004909995|nr:dipicolinate synthase subunit DpsA [Pseudonocardia spinosispora]